MLLRGVSWNLSEKDHSCSNTHKKESVKPDHLQNYVQNTSLHYYKK
jgi:hypothetical protein